MKQTKLKTTRQMAEEDLKRIFAKHIGEENKISRAALFYKVYRIKLSNVEPLKAALMWTKILNACSYCRKHTNCTIMSDYYKFAGVKGMSGSYYFVAETVDEAQKHFGRLNKISKGISRSAKAFLKKVKTGQTSDPYYW